MSQNVASSAAEMGEGQGIVRRVVAVALAGLSSAAILYLVPQSVTPQPDRTLADQNLTLQAQAEHLKSLSPSERAPLIAREQAILAAEPLDALALANLADLHRAEGDIEKSNALFSLAAKRSLRDLRIQSEAVDLAITRQDYASALFSLDALIRAQPANKPNFYKLLYGFASAEPSMKALAAYLAKQPSWRLEFIKSFAANAPNVQTVYWLISQIRDSGGEVSDVEIRGLIDRAVKMGDFDLGYFIWLDFLTPAELRKVGNIFDGSFDLVPRGFSFDWTLAQSKQIESRVVPRVGSRGDQVLQVTFAGGRLTAPPALQYLRLPPGNYVLSGESRTENLDAGAGVLWTIRCVPAAGQPATPPLMSSRAFLGETQWDKFESKFAIPDSGCPTQLLSLNPGSAAKLDQVIKGKVYFDNMSISVATAEQSDGG